jgi:hypothetical protein
MVWTGQQVPYSSELYAINDVASIWDKLLVVGILAQQIAGDLGRLVQVNIISQKN